MSNYFFKGSVSSLFNILNPKNHNFSNFIISFFSIIPSAKASIVDKNYISYQDVYDGTLNVLFPIFFVILFSFKNSPSTSMKKNLLPILDDILYNIVTWLIPLVVSVSYDDLLIIKIFAFVNMFLHVICAIIAVSLHKTIKQMNTELKLQYLSQMIRSFLIFFPVIIIPIFWTIYITIQHNFDLIDTCFLILFCLILISILFMLFISAFKNHEKRQERRWVHIFAIFWFYSPNTLQTLLIMLKWPINIYFVKLWLFVLILSLTRNVSYYVDKMPDDFLATSTTLVQSFLSFVLYEEDSRVCVNISDSSNPFTFTSEDLGRLFEPTLKNFSLLEGYGGTDGLIKGLHSDSQVGLNGELEPIGDFGDEDDEQNLIEGSPFYQRIKIFGKNSLPEKKSRFIFELMWMAIQEKGLILLIIAAFFSLVLGLYRDIGAKEVNQTKIHWIEGVAIIITVLIVVLIGSLNDWQKERQFQKLNAKKEDRKIKAIRNGRKTLISVHDILVGDVLHLEPGDVTAADGVLISGLNLHCDESAATGESDAVKKLKYEDCLKEEKDDDDVAYHHKADPFIISGSKVSEGIGIYLVTGIGANSFYGKIMMSLKTEPEDGPLQKKLNDFAEKIAKLGGSVSLLMFIILLIKYFISFRNGIPAVTDIFDDLIRIIISTITLVIVAVPEGLPLAITLALTYSTTRMLEDDIIVRVLSACEKMSYITTICSDKTGTLTQNKMAVVAGTIGLSFSFFRNRNDYSSALKKDSTGITVLLEDINQKLPEDILQLLKESIAINSTAFETSEDGKRTFVGSKTETALLEFLLFDLNLDDIKLLRENAEIVQLFTFNSERKSMGIVIKTKDSKWRFFVKGASEIILERSVKIINIVKSDDNIITDSIIDLTQDHFVKVQNAIKNYATQSLRTIGIAYRDFEKSQVEEMAKNSGGEISYEDLFDKLTLLSIVGIEDQLREGVREAVRMCIKAGVKVLMVTGDNILTAKSIATQCGIYTDGRVMEGPEFRKLSPEQMDRILPKLQILARCSPEDKTLLVGHLKRLGDVVAVTGDGTNDGPALKLSDVGYSMGITGTEVAKEASSIILADDNFLRIIISIMWGRNINEAIKKFLQFQLTVNITAVLLTFITSILGDPILTSVQLLWINLIMDTFASLALSTDPAKNLLLDKKPESRRYAPLISIDMWKMIIGQSICQLVITLVLFFVHKADKPSFANLAQKNTFIFNTFIFLQIFNEINCRKLDNKKNIFEGVLANKFLMIIFVIMVVGQFLIVQFGGAAFQVEPLSIKEWVVSVILGFLSIPIGFLIRLIPTYHHHTAPPVFNIDLEKDWDDTVTQVQNQLHFFKLLRGGRIRANFGDRIEKTETRSKAIAAAAMLPSLISASVGIQMTHDNNMGNSTN